MSFKQNTLMTSGPKTGGRSTEDLQAVKRAAGNIEAFADRKIAHLDKRSETRPPRATIDDLDRSLDLLEKLTLKYYTLFTGYEVVGGLLPTHQYDWKRIFSQPWIREDQ